MGRGMAHCAIESKKDIECVCVCAACVCVKHEGQSHMSSHCLTQHNDSDCQWVRQPNLQLPSVRSLSVAASVIVPELRFKHCRSSVNSGEKILRQRDTLIG